MASPKGGGNVTASANYPLFGDLPDFRPKPIARASDPATSHEAAAHMATRLGEAQEWALGILRANPGRTSNELDKIAGTPRGDVRKRLPELERAGLAYRDGVRVCGVTGFKAAVWWPKLSEDI